MSVLPSGLGLIAAPLSPTSLETDSGSSFQPSDARVDARGKSEEAFAAEAGRLESVLDYSGLAVWDWSKAGVRQTPSLCRLLGAEERGVFDPESFTKLLDKDAQRSFDDGVIGVKRGDGSFDDVLKTAAGGVVRMRGARAVSPTGQLERIVLFVENAAQAPTISGSAVTGDEKDAVGSSTLLTAAAASLAGAASASDRRRVGDDVSLQDVSAAIDSGDIVPAFQPIVSLKDRSVVGYETLLRWPAREGDEKASAPAIVRAAQLAGRGRDLSSLVVNAAAEKIVEARRGESKGDETSAGFAGGLKRLSKRKPETSASAPFAAFNVSVSQLLDQGFADAVKDAIKTHNLPARSLVLEVTETEQFADDASLERLFADLRRAGVALAMDDFGAGFSSFANLNKFQFDYLKIDKSFVEDMGEDKSARRIVNALAGLGKDLGLTVIAEGVENEGVAADLAAAGCSMAQGYLFGDVVVAAKKTSKPKARVTDHAAPSEKETMFKRASANSEEKVDAVDKADEEPKRGFRLNGGFARKDKARLSRKSLLTREVPPREPEAAELAETAVSEAPAAERRTALAEDLQAERDADVAPARRRMSSRVRRLR